MKRKTGFTSYSILLVILLSVCATTPVAEITAILSPADTATPTATHPPLPTITPIPTHTLTLIPTPAVTSTPTNTLTATPTSDPYAGLTIADLMARDYGGGELQIESTLEVTNAFTRTLVYYPSDGLTIYGFMNMPQGEGPFPVALVLHGYIPPERYYTVAYTARYADALARAGYLVIHPNLRNYPPSDEGPDQFRVGSAIDILNLIAIIREQSGQAGPLELANPSFIGLMGHSMGGGISLRLATVSDNVQAVALYGAMSGDEKKNYEKILYWSGGERGHYEYNTPDADLERISPIFHLDHISSPISIHHGEIDEQVPLEWSTDLCERLQAFDKPVECFIYDHQPHTFYGEGDRLFTKRVIEFFDRQRTENAAPSLPTD